MVSDAISQGDAPVSRAGAAPLWAQVKAAITDMIVEGGMQEGDRLPSEADLCERFGVSRIVVRQAMSRLVNERLIYRHQGRGAFVAKPREDSDFVSRIVGFSGELGVSNRKVSRRVLDVDIRRPSARVRNFLGLEAGAEVVYLNRVMSVDGVPRILVESAIVLQFVPDLLTVDLADRSLYEVLETRYGIVFEGAERWIEAASASADQAKLLGVPEGTALLGIESRSFVKSGAFIEYFSAFYRTDQARLHFAVRPEQFAKTRNRTPHPARR